jgi:hypothetical protein
VNDTVFKELPKVLLAFVVGLSGSALGVGLVSWRDLALTGQSVGDLERRVAAVEVLAAAMGKETTMNSLARLEHRTQLDKLIDLVERIKEEVISLRIQPQARPDPFTGTQGRELENRIRMLEGR